VIFTLVKPKTPWTPVLRGASIDFMAR